MIKTVDEQLKLKEFYGEKEWSRILKIYEPGTTKEEENHIFKMVYGNQLAKNRYRIKKMVNNLCDLEFIRSRLERDVRLIEQANTDIKLATDEVEKMISDIGEAIDLQEKFLGAEADLLMELLKLYKVVATDHDFAQIINTSIKDIESYRKHYEEYRGEKTDEQFFLALIFVYQAEYRGRRSIKGEPSDVPLRMCIYQRGIETGCDEA